MAKARDFEKCALVMGVLSTSEEKREELFSILEKNFGPIRVATEAQTFPYTDYYDSEMSGHPVRYFLYFQNLIDPFLLADIKTKTNEIELSFSDEIGRRINLDPGTLSLDNFILATCKDRSHRIPLRNGIYGEVTLIYQNKDFQTLPWTYADYSSPEVKAILCNFRDYFKAASKQAK